MYSTRQWNISRTAFLMRVSLFQKPVKWNFVSIEISSTIIMYHELKIYRVLLTIQWPCAPFHGAQPCRPICVNPAVFEYKWTLKTTGRRSRVSIIYLNVMLFAVRATSSIPISLLYLGDRLPDVISTYKWLSGALTSSSIIELILLSMIYNFTSIIRRFSSSGHHGRQ